MTSRASLRMTTPQKGFTLSAARLSLLVGAFALAAPGGALAGERCAGALQSDVCAEATGSCPQVDGPLGVTQTNWPVFQHDVYHTGKTDQVGPTCANPTVLWQSALRGRIFSAPVIGPGPSGTIYIGVSHNPICALDSNDGSVKWCGTDAPGKDAHFASPALANNGYLYVGTRDNDLWAIQVPNPETPPTQGSVAWREKVCTDGDVTTPPVVGKDGVIYFGSNSLSAGTLMAMCPGPDRRVKWCVNPAGGSIADVSPALSPDGKRVYSTLQGALLASWDASTGEQKWKTELERRRNGGTSTNFSPVVNPKTGTIYTGFDEGVFAVDVTVQGNKETPVAKLFYATLDTDGARVNSPPALDLDRQTLYFGATDITRNGFLYAVGLDGKLRWRIDLGPGEFRNNPPAIDGAGRIYVVLADTLFAVNPDGSIAWQMDLQANAFASPVIDAGRVYIGTKRGGSMYAIGCPQNPS